jgi:hypothetical protein
MVLKFKKTFIFFIFTLSFCVYADTAYANHYDEDSTLFTNVYNNKIYSSVIDAAKSIARPFLLQQGYISTPNITVVDTSLLYKGIKYPVSQAYNINRNSGFYISSSLYKSYDINNFKVVWPIKFPNICFNSSTKTFTSLLDCVGYGTRVLSAVGDTTINGNAYASLVSQVIAANVADMAPPGRAADSYQLATAFATLNSSTTGWQYISGNVLNAAINTYNHTFNVNLNAYTGVRKGGFAASKAGDMLVFGNGPKASATGHTMIIDTTPVLLNTAGLKKFFPNQSNNNLNAFLILNHIYAVGILDDCDILHFNDSRTTISGIGHATILIVTDTLDDAPVGYVFAPKTTLSFTPVDTSKTYAITVARYTSAAQLPVLISSFEAIHQGKNIILKWQTGIEINAAYFNIQRSINGKDFTTISTSKATGTGAYFYDDYNKLNVEMLFYRLEIIDKDGSKTYSANRQVMMKDMQLTIAPNPAKNIITVYGSNLKQINIVDLNGKTVITNQLNSNSTKLVISNLSKGVYVVKASYIDGSVKMEKLLVN